MNRISRKVATMGAAGVLALASIGGVVGHTAVHAASIPAAAQMAPDTNAVQQDVQVGSQQSLGPVDTDHYLERRRGSGGWQPEGPGGVDTAEVTALAAPDTETLGARAATAHGSLVVQSAGPQATGAEANAATDTVADTDANAPCSGQDEATQTGNCDTQSQSAAGPEDTAGAPSDGAGSGTEAVDSGP